MTTPEPTVVDERRDDALESIANRLRDVEERIAELDELKRDLTAQAVAYLDVTQAGTVYAHGKPVLEIRVGRRFNADRAREVLGSNVALLEACSESVVSSSKAKAVLPPNVYELCQVETAPTVKPVKARA